MMALATQVLFSEHTSCQINAVVCFNLLSHSGIRIETLPDESHPDPLHIWLVYIPAASKVIG